LLPALGAGQPLRLRGLHRVTASAQLDTGWAGISLSLHVPELERVASSGRARRTVLAVGRFSSEGRAAPADELKMIDDFFNMIFAEDTATLRTWSPID
jgi:hypothetical protein